MIRKIISLLLCCFCLLFVGCSKTDNNDSSAEVNTDNSEISEDSIEIGELELVDSNGYLTKAGAISIFPGIWEGECVEGLEDGREFKTNFVICPDGRFYEYSCSTSVYTGKTSCTAYKWYKWDIREDGTFTTTYNASWTTKYKYIDDDTLETSYPAGTKFIWTRLSNDVSTAPTTPDDYVKPSAFGESDSNEPTTVEIGLGKDQVIELWGYPTRKNITETKYGKHEQWVYEKFSKTRYVYFDNDVVTAIQY